jgi:hypothetical protein
MELWGRPLVFKFPTAEALIVLLFINPLNSQFRIFSHGILSRRSFVALCEDGSPALSNDDGSDFNIVFIWLRLLGYITKLNPLILFTAESAEKNK